MYEQSIQLTFAISTN